MAAGTRPKMTPTGVIVATAAVAFVVVGWALGYRGVTVVGAMLAVGVVIGCAVTLFVPNLHVRRAVEPARVARGNPAHGLVSVRNRASRRSRAVRALETVGGETIAVDIPSLAPGRSVAVPYDLPTRRRGPLVVGPLAIARHDPFGLWQSTRSLGECVTVLVEPRVHVIDPRPAGRARHLDGPVSDTAPRGTLTFHSLREYTPGDDIRRVHWKSSARTGTLMVREHVDTSLPSTVIVLDTRAESYTDDRFEDAVDIAASVVAASQGRGFPVRMISASGRVLVSRAGQSGHDIRDYLATVVADDAGSLQPATTRVLQAREHDAIVVIGGIVAPADLAEVTTMCRRFSTAVLVTVRDSGGPVWNAGAHLDGVDATTALLRWPKPASAVRRVEVAS